MDDQKHLPLAERESLEEFLANVPISPGVYLMKNREEKVIYVGKALKLRARVRNYFNASSDTRPAMEFLRKRVFNIETFVTQNQKEALLLENTLIKQYQPRYNIKLRDDKTYLGLRLSVRDRIARLSAVRRPLKDGALYFGPFHSASALHKVRRLLQKLFGVRVCTDTFFRNRTRPCIEYQIGRCLAPCVDGLVSEADYLEAVENTRRFLNGQTGPIVRKLEAEMKAASRQEAYEKAIQKRNLLLAVKETLSRQVVASHENIKDQDILGLHREDGFGEYYVLFVRNGQVVGGKSYSLGMNFGEDEEVLTSAMLQYYSSPYHSLPREILLPFKMHDAGTLLEALCEAAKERPQEQLGKLRLSVPKRGKNLRLVKMAHENAKANFDNAQRNTERAEKILSELQKRLNLTRRPERIECFDISNIQGNQAVGSMVVFRGVDPDKKSYRHFKIRGVKGINDFEMLKEVLSRRFKNGGEEHPDLLIVDGGKGQLKMAEVVTAELQLKDFAIAAMAKAKTLPQAKGRSEERIFLPGRMNPVTFARDSGCLFLLQRLRDEAHRFAITHHRKLRKKATLHSQLDEIQGIGPAKRKFLLKEFGSVDGVKEATLEELEKRGRLSKNLAVKVKEFLTSS